MPISKTMCAMENEVKWSEELSFFSFVQHSCFSVTCYVVLLVFLWFRRVHFNRFFVNFSCDIFLICVHQFFNIFSFSLYSFAVVDGDDVFVEDAFVVERRTLVFYDVTIIWSKNSFCIIFQLSTYIHCRL